MMWTQLKIQNRNDSTYNRSITNEYELLHVENYLRVWVENMTSLRVGISAIDPITQALTEQVFTVRNYSMLYETWVLYEFTLTQLRFVLRVNQEVTFNQSINITSFQPGNSLNMSVGNRRSNSQNEFNTLQFMIYSFALFRHKTQIANDQFQTPLNLKNKLYPNNQASLDESLYEEIAQYQFTSENYQAVIDDTTSASTYQFASFSQYSIPWLLQDQATFTQFSQAFCPQDTPSLFDGISCKSPKLSPGFYSADQLQTNKFFTAASTLTLPPTFTTDLWFKRILSADAFAENVLYASYDSNDTMHLKISYVASSIQCNYRDSTVNIQYLIALDSWYHVACVVEQERIVLILFEQKSGLSFAAETQNQISDVIISVKRTIGNFKTGQMSANAYQREIRVLNYAVSLTQMEAIRYQKITKHQNLMSLFTMSEGYQSQNITDSIDRQLQSSTINDVLSWSASDDLSVCPINTIYDGSCCKKINNSDFKLTLSFQENIDTGLVTISANLTGIPQRIQGFENYTWSLYRVNASKIDTFINSSMLQLKQTLQSQQGKPSLSLPSSLFFLNSSYSFSVLLSTPFQSRPFQLAFIAVNLTCPRLSLTPPTLSPLIHQLFYETKLTLNVQSQLACFGQSAITIKSVTWKHNNTLGDPYTIASNKQSVTFNKEGMLKADSIVRINSSVVLSNGKMYNETRVIQFVRQSVLLNVTNQNNGTMLLTEGDDLVIDASNSKFLANTISRSEMAFNVTCPVSMLQQTSDCSFNQSTGILSIPWTNFNSTVPNIEYSFFIQIGKPKSTQATANMTVKVRWMTKLSDTMAKCPGVYPSQNMNLTVLRPYMKANWTYGPAFAQDCPQSYKRTKVNYTIDMLRIQQLKQVSLSSGNQTYYPLVPNLTSYNFTDTFTLLNDGYQLVFKNDSVIQRLKPSNIIPITIFAEFFDNATNKTVNDSTQIEFSIIQNDIVLRSQNPDTDPFNGGSKRFNFEEDLFINISSSHDLDYASQSFGQLRLNSSVLEYSYICNGTTCNIDPNQTKGGVLNITAWDRMRLNYPYDQEIPISITAKNPLVPWKPSQVYSFNAIISKPTNGSVNCPQTNFNVTLPDGSNIQRTQQLIYSITNVSDFSVRVQPDNCDQNLTYQFIQFLVDVPLYGILNATSFTYKTINASNILQFKKEQLLSLISPGQGITLTSIMMFNYTANNSKKFGYSTSNLTILRVYSLLQPILKANYTSSLTDKSLTSLNAYNIGQEEFVYLDASLSYDPDSAVGLDEMNFAYTCSSGISEEWCISIQNQRNFVIEKQQRLAWGQNDLGSQFWIALDLQLQERKSQIANITFNIAQQEVSKCIQIQDQYQQLTIPSNPLLPITLRPSVSYFCDPGNAISVGYTFDFNQDDFRFGSQSIPKSDSFDFQLNLFPKVQTLTSQKIHVSSVLSNDQSQSPLSNIFDYTIASSLMQTPNLVQDSQDINFYTLEPFFITEQNVQNCQFTCRFGDLQVENCGDIASGQCKSNVMLTAYLYKDQLLTPDTVSSIQVSAPYVKTVRMALNFVNNDPTVTELLQCLIESTWPTIMSDRINTFNASCEGYKSRELKFTWYLHTIYTNMQTPQKIVKVGERQILRLDPQLFNERTGLFYQLRVSIVKRADANVLRQLSFVPELPDPSNIQTGAASLSLAFSNDIIIGNLTLSGYSDVNMGQLYFSLYYTSSSTKQNVYLVSKSTETNFLFLFPTDLSTLFLEIRDLSDVLLIQSIDASQPWNSPLSLDQINQIDQYFQLTNAKQEPLSISKFDTVTYALSVAIRDVNDKDQHSSLCQAAINHFGNYTDTDKLTRTFFLPVSLQRTLSNINSCLSNTSEALQVLDILINKFDISEIMPTEESNDIFDLPLSPIRTQIVKEYDTLLSHLMNFTDIDNSTLEYLAFLSKQSKEIQFQQVDMGESTTIQGVAMSKITLSEWPVGDTLTVKKDSVTLGFDPLKLELLNISEATVKVSAPASIDFDEAQYPNISLYGDVVEVKIYDQEDNQVITESLNLDAVLTFNKVNLKSAKVKCGWYDEAQSKWLFNSDGRISPIVDKTNNRVQCWTTHFSIFSIFNQTVLSEEVPVLSSPEDMDAQDKAVLTVSLIQFFFIILSVVLFITNYCIQRKVEAEAISENYATQLRHELNFRRLLKVLSPAIAFWNLKDPLNKALRSLILINYLLFISLFILIHLAINPYNKPAGEIVWLIISLIVIFALCSGAVRHHLVSRFIQDITVSNFIANLWKAPVDDYMSKVAKPVPTAAEEIGHIPPITATNSKNKAYIEVEQLENDKVPSFLRVIPTDFLKVPTAMAPLYKNEESKEESDDSMRAKDMHVETGSDHGEAVKRSVMDYRMRIESAGKQKFEEQPVDEEAFHHIFAVQSQDGLKESVYEQDSSMEHSRHIGHTEKNMEYLHSRNNNQASHQASRLFNNNNNEQEEYPDNIYQEFEGGTQEQGPELTPTGVTNRRDLYRTQDFQTENHSLKGSKEPKQAPVHMVKVDNLKLALAQGALFLVGLALNIFLFVWVEISDQAAPYCAAFFISVTLLLFVIDPLLALAAHLTLRQVLGGSKNVFAYGIIGYKWLQLID
ncbi:hypothetical protein FGO68_gene11348 [Halteria grandinella]|uniref:Uncharacterized protein n=1 Tax=Halteria grandinella TaxID=5974 RepID=A0A8J8TA76_HALGN|nr:hypothetical protein FGO68_gene11348 [Halteria grandinella]